MYTLLLLYVGCYYYTLGNIHPSYRSTLSSIQLLCLVEVPILEKYGHDLILKPAIEDIKKLEEVGKSLISINLHQLKLWL